MIPLLIQYLVFLITIYYAIYVLLELRIIFISRKKEQIQLNEINSSGKSPCISDKLPKVTVLLPVYNESAVIERLIDSVCRLKYPKVLLEIIVLDDSDDETINLAENKVKFHLGYGIDIKHIRRSNRSGFKAGNLLNGINLAKGDFFAIFDADFIPPENFLLKTIPCFDDEDVGYLQTGIGYTNRDYSFLTRFQAMIMGHQQFVTVGLSEDGCMGSLSGSSCVWRKECVDDIGNWKADTVTEDVDLGYRAQCNNWKFAYLRDVVSLSDLPETLSAFRVQRDRWAKGLIHNAFRHFTIMLRMKMPLLKRLYAVSLMFSSMLLASFFVLIILSVPLVLIPKEKLSGIFYASCIIFAIAISLWTINNYIGTKKGGRFTNKNLSIKYILYMYLYSSMFLPLSLYYFSAGIQIFFGINKNFQRTPKGTKKKSEKPHNLNTVLQLTEIMVFIYSSFGICAGIYMRNYWLLPFNLTVCFGYGIVIYFSYKELYSR